MSTTTLAAEDWKKVYQTFKDADFQSYDFETLRKSMIDYLRLYYPEDFNDFIESSEYVALIDLIAFLGQSLAFRTDLNARENFLDTAERRDSILKLARLISYTPKRAIPSSGLLKIDFVSTTETTFDSTGIDITGVPIAWNDSTNDNWLEQLMLVNNSALIDSQMIGKSGNSQIINGIKTDEYTINLNRTTLPIFSFAANVDGKQTQFEVVSASTAGSPNLYEVPPQPTSLFNILYRNDNNGNSSINTGFFLYFKQGELKTTGFNLKESLANRVVSINTPNINNNDIWIYQLSADGQVQTEWKKVPTVTGMNIVYNTEVDRNLVQVVTKQNDQVDLVFGDGSFSNIPQGNFAVYYRTSTSGNYRITPSEMQNVQVSIEYVSRIGRVETLTLSGSLHYTVTNAVAREDIESIRSRAPQMYYTQNRMITGEDYNLFPYANFSNILKVKAVNRTSSGISRFLDVTDVTGKYSSTNIFADDGRLYKNQFLKQFSFTFNSFVDIYKTMYSSLVSIFQSKELVHFYYDTYPRYTLSDCLWQLPNETPGYARTASAGTSGYFAKADTSKIQVGYVTSTNAKYIRPGSILKMSAPTGQYFDAHNDLITGTPVYATERTAIYVTVMQVIGDGTNGGQGAFDDGSGPITLNVKVPTGAIVEQIIPSLKNSLPTSEIDALITTYILEYKNFGLAYSPISQQWQTISPENLDLNLSHDFSLANFGDTSSQSIDASWSVAFKFTGSEYVIYYRGTDFVFESNSQVKFYFDEKIRTFDSKTGRTLSDQILILKTNNKPDSTSSFDSDTPWFVYKNIVEVDGHTLNNKILLTYADTNVDGVPDNPDVFNDLVAPTVESTKKLVFFKTIAGNEYFINETPVDSSSVVVRFNSKAEIEQSVFLYNSGQLFYVLPTKTFYILEEILLNRVVSEVTGYSAYYGRDSFSFQYKHNSPNYRRIDPSPNNIVDMYILVKSYSDDYSKWIRDTTDKVTEPTKPTNEDLELMFSDLQKYKPISDAIILNSAKFKPLFGPKATPALQASFKVVKNPSIIVSDNDVKSKLITEINTYFDAELREFGETFFFSELSAYLHTALSPMVSSIILVPRATESVFGSLFQISSEPDEILSSAATVDDVEIITAITLSQLTHS